MSNAHDVERRKRLLAFFPRELAPTSQRQAALQRARWSVVVLDEVMRILADETESSGAVAAAVRIADEVSRATERRRTKVSTRAAMELIDCIKWAADDVLDRGLDLENAVTHVVSFGVSWPDLLPKVDDAAFRRAVEAWIACEQAMRRSGRRAGRTPKKWPQVFAALKASGLENGLTNPRSTCKSWEEWNRNSANS